MTRTGRSFRIVRTGYIWPAEQANATAEVATKRQGYNLLHWTNSGINYWAVSDLNTVELHEFARLVQEAQ